MKLFKSLFAVGALLFTLTSKADVATYNPTATAIASILRKPVAIQQITFANAATNSVTITFTDSPTNTTTFLVGAYTNTVYTISDVVTTFTNITGKVQSSTNSTLVATPTAVTAVTNSYRTFGVFTVPASGSIVFNPPQSQPVGFGLAASTTATNVVATIIYLPLR